MYKWILPTLSEVLALAESMQFLPSQGRSSRSLASCLTDKVQTAVTNKGNATSSVGVNDQYAVKRFKAEREWYGAIAALEQLLLQSFALEDTSSPQGMMLAGPVPVLSLGELLPYLPTWIFTTESLKSKLGMPFQLPPATASEPIGLRRPQLSVESSAQNSSIKTETLNAGSILPLLPDDPLASEQFCLVLTTHFSLVMVLGENLDGMPAFLFSFEPEVAEQAWQSLRARILLNNSQSSLELLDALFEKYYPVAPDYRLVTQFSRLLLDYLPESLPREAPLCSGEWESGRVAEDVELLQAFAHEVRTPLTTIRTLTRLLLKRRELSTEVIKRLEVIDHECTAQIDRMELLFRAAELEISTVKPNSTHLTAMSLAQVLQQSIPRWHQSANRRDLTLDVVLPQHLPTVVSDPKMLDQVLTGLIENFTRSLPAGSHIQVQVIPAGDQLKLQLQPESGKAAEPFLVPPPIRKSLGELLTFQPETGNISLNIAATKHLFQAIGGKLIVRQRPHQGEVLTIFLPMEVSNTVQS